MTHPEAVQLITRLEAVTVQLSDGPATSVKRVVHNERGRIQEVREILPRFDPAALASEGERLIKQIAGMTLDGNDDRAAAAQAEASFFRAVEPFADARSQHRIAETLEEGEAAWRAVGRPLR